MLRTSLSIFSLLAGTAILLAGMGLQGTLVGLRANVEQFSPDVIGLVMSAYFLGFVLGAHLCPPIIRQVGHIRAFAVMATLASAIAVAYAVWVNPFTWAILRTLTGICMVGLYTVIESWLNKIAPNHLRGQIFSIYMATTLLAMAAGQYMLLLGDVGSFELFAIVTILLSLAVVPIAMTRLVQPELTEDSRLKLAFLYRASPLGIVGTVATGIATGAFWGMTPLYAVAIGLDDSGVARLMSATIIGGVLLQWPVGHYSDRIDRRRIIATAAGIATFMALCMFWFGQRESALMYLVAFLFGGCLFSLYSLSVATVQDQLEHHQVLDATRTLLLLYGIGAMTGPTILGRAMKFLGPEVLPVCFALVMGLLVLFALYQLHARVVRPEEQVELIPMVRTSPEALEMAPGLTEEEEQKGAGE